MKPTSRRLLLRLVVIQVFSAAFGAIAAAREQQVQPSGVPAGPIPTVQAVEVTAAGRATFRPSMDVPARPAHPPIDQIPPMPMPVPPADPERQASAAGASSPVVHDLHTASTSVLAGSAGASTNEYAARAGFAGVYGTTPDTLTPSTMFGSMTLLSPDVRRTAPHAMNVKLVMRFGTNFFVCSGTMRDAEVALTAGHCVYDFGGAGWANEIWVYPAWDGNDSIVPPSSTTNPFGWGYATRLGSNTGWTNSGNFDFDAGYVEIDRAVGMITGWFGWSIGGPCSYWQTQTVASGSYPAENCGTPGLHNGRDMYQWVGRFDSCFSNQLQLNTVPGCTTAIWGGQSGSGVYETIGADRLVHGITSRSDRAFVGLFVRQWADWVNFGDTSFIPAARGAAFDIQPLFMSASATIAPGGITRILSHLATNATNASATGTWSFKVYLSTNDNIEPTDTLLSSQVVTATIAPMQWANVVMAPVMIPLDTPPGTYWIGVIYDNGQDANDANNDTDGWDAKRIQVVGGDQDITLSSIFAPPIAAPGSSITVSTNPQNLGTGPAPAFSVGLYLSADSTCTTSDTFLGTHNYPGLTQFGSDTAQSVVTIPADTPLSSRFFCAIVDPANLISETNENNNTSSQPIAIAPALPVVTLKVNGVDAANVPTTGPFHLTVDISLSTMSTPLDWYWALVYNGTVFWVTPSGLSSTPAPLVTALPGPVSNLTLLNFTLPSGTTITNAIILVDGATALSFDVITATR